MATILSREDYILFILNNLEPEKSTKFYLNKLAFLVEFSYLFFNNGKQELSNTNYAAINHGPIIDNYSEILASMEKKGLIKLNGNSIRVLTTRTVTVPDDIANLARQQIRKYSALSFAELKAITHETDSYKITTKNEKVMGNSIDKKLAALETFFDEGGETEEQVPISKLPKINKKNLVKYEFGSIV